ncbi:MAG: hypothetical protein FWD28_02185 [Treponema sp.]|nr:hypothetical protein [Treponema sp.]
MSDDQDRMYQERLDQERREAEQKVLDKQVDVAAKATGNLFMVAVALFLIIPSLAAVIFDVIFAQLFKLKTAGRVIQSAIMGLAIGLVLIVILSVVFQNTLEPILDNNNFLKMLFFAACCGLPALWYYYSHYFSLRVLMHNENYAAATKKKRTRGEINKTSMFVYPFAIIFYGTVVLFIIHTVQRNSGGGIPSILYLIPFAGAAILYIIKTLSAREKAKQLKAEEKSPIIGAPIAVILACIIPFTMVSESNSSSSASNQRESLIEATKNAATQNVTAKVTSNKAYVKSNPSNNDGDFVRMFPNKARGIVVNITGEAVARNDIIWIPIEYRGQKGYIEERFVRIQKR